MAGGFEFLEGEYGFSLYRIINKTFKILPKSKITWTDCPPHEGILDVQATYEQRASLHPLGIAAEEKYSVQVLVALQGGLLAPDMNFQVNFLAYPSDIAARTAISDFQNKAKEDKRYLTQQVVSLVVFNKFAESKLKVDSGDTINRNLSALVSRQLGSLVSDLDEKLQVDTDVDLEELSNKGLAGVRFKISRSFFDGRLQVAREGSLGVDAANEAGITQMIGAWTVAYFLTQDGRLRAKFYNKYVANPTYVGPDSAAGFVGCSLLYIRGFNQWRELFGGRKKAQKSVSKEK